MRSIRRINLFGGPGVGKSLLALWLVHELRVRGHLCELVQEAIKPMAYRRAMPGHWQELTQVFSEQLERERDWLESGVDLIVTDSPLLLQCYYQSLRESPCLAGSLAIAQAWDDDRPSLNILLEPGDWQYQQAGRWETREEAEAKSLDIAKFVSGYVSCFMAKADHRGEVLDYVLANIPKVCEVSQ